MPNIEEEKLTCLYRIRSKEESRWKGNAPVLENVLFYWSVRVEVAAGFRIVGLDVLPFSFLSVETFCRNSVILSV